MSRALGATAALALLLVIAACGSSSKSGSADNVPEVVSGKSWTALTVSNGSASVDVPAGDRAILVPLLATRFLDRPAPLTEYGLDHPQAVLTYKAGSGASAEVDIGQPNFDRHFVYVQRRGRPGVYLVAADTLRPVLGLVGIEIQPPV